jgi:hypothetical protein
MPRPISSRRNSRSSRFSYGVVINGAAFEHSRFTTSHWFQANQAEEEE